MLPGGRCRPTPCRDDAAGGVGSEPSISPAITIAPRPTGLVARRREVSFILIQRDAAAASPGSGWQWASHRVHQRRCPSACSRRMECMSEPLPPDVRAALDASNKIEAIRLLRAHTGLGLHDAKAAVASGSLPAKPLPRPALPDRLPVEAIAALQSGSKIEAIKIVRSAFGIDLKDAKTIVDAAALRALWLNGGRMMLAACSRTRARKVVSGSRCWPA